MPGDGDKGVKKTLDSVRPDEGWRRGESRGNEGRKWGLLESNTTAVLGERRETIVIPIKKESRRTRKILKKNGPRRNQRKKSGTRIERGFGDSARSWLEVGRREGAAPGEGWIKRDHAPAIYWE